MGRNIFWSSFSESTAIIEKVGGEVILLRELAKEYKKGLKVRIIG